jgi:hypothetical protein
LGFYVGGVGGQRSAFIGNYTHGSKKLVMGQSKLPITKEKEKETFEIPHN